MAIWFLLLYELYKYLELQKPKKYVESKFTFLRQNLAKASENHYTLLNTTQTWFSSSSCVIQLFFQESVNHERNRSPMIKTKQKVKIQLPRRRWFDRNTSPLYFFDIFCDDLVILGAQWNWKSLWLCACLKAAWSDYILNSMYVVKRRLCLECV